MLRNRIRVFVKGNAMVPRSQQGLLWIGRSHWDKQNNQTNLPELIDVCFPHVEELSLIAIFSKFPNLGGHTKPNHILNVLFFSVLDFQTSTTQNFRSQT
jgi:hypothetical protein